MSNRPVALACMLALALAGCPKKPGAGGDASTDAAIVADADVPDAATAEATPDTDAAVLPTATATVVKVVPKLPDGGVVVETCCCSAPGESPSQVGMSDCVKLKKGQCVKKEICAVAPVVDAGPAPAPTPAPTPTPIATCCCDTKGKRENKNTAECLKGHAGKCVKADLCK